MERNNVKFILNKAVWENIRRGLASRVIMNKPNRDISCEVVERVDGHLWTAWRAVKEGMVENITDRIRQQ